MMRVVAIIQARMGSSRLPGKSMADLSGKPVLGRVIDRTRLVPSIGEVAVATSTDPRDDPIAAFSEDVGVPCHRGSEMDVLDRYHRAARELEAEIVVRITGDCPLLDPDVTERVVARVLDEDVDYVSNFLRRTYPKGLDSEAFTSRALRRAWEEARTPEQREHVTPYLYDPLSGFRVANVEQAVDRSAWRWTVDFPEDLEFARAVYAAIGRPDFGQEEVARLLAADPSLISILGDHAWDMSRQP